MLSLLLLLKGQGGVCVLEGGAFEASLHRGWELVARIGGRNAGTLQPGGLEEEPEGEEPTV